MNDMLKSLRDKARELAPIERAELVEDILRSLDATDPRIDSLWAEEAKDRSAAMKRGELAARDLDEVLEKYEKK
jgi:hypothetical protein